MAAKKKGRRTGPSELEKRFALLWRACEGPALETEFQFHPTRKWRADFAHLPSKTIIEIEGGIFMRGGGRHNRGIGYANDAEKYLEAVFEGWTVLRLTQVQLNLKWVARIVGLVHANEKPGPVMDTAAGHPELPLGD